MIKINDWLSASTMNGNGSGKVSFTTALNPKVEVRTARLFIKGGNRESAITITQTELVQFVSASPVNIIFDAIGGTATIALTATEGWTATTTDSWLTLSQAEGEMGNFNITATAEKTDSKAYRYAAIHFKGEVGDEVDVQVTQYSPYIAIENSDGVEISTISNVPASGMADYALIVDTKSKWAVKDVSDGLTISTTSGNGMANITISVNEWGYYEKTYTATFYLTEYEGVSKTLTVYQEMMEDAPLPTSENIFYYQTTNGNGTYGGTWYSDLKLWGIDMSNKRSIMEEDGFSSSTLTVASIPSCIKTVGSKSFYGSGSLFMVRLAEGVEILDGYCFENTALSQLIIPLSMTNLYGCLIYGTNVKMIRFVGNAPQAGDDHTLLTYHPFEGAKKEGTLYIPQGKASSYTYYTDFLTATGMGWTVEEYAAPVFYAEDETDTILTKGETVVKNYTSENVLDEYSIKSSNSAFTGYMKVLGSQLSIYAEESSDGGEGLITLTNYYNDPYYGKTPIYLTWNAYTMVYIKDSLSVSDVSCQIPTVTYTIVGCESAPTVTSTNAKISNITLVDGNYTFDATFKVNYYGERQVSFSVNGVEKMKVWQYGYAPWVPELSWVTLSEGTAYTSTSTSYYLCKNIESISESLEVLSGSSSISVTHHLSGQSLNFNIVCKKLVGKSSQVVRVTVTGKNKYGYTIQQQFIITRNW